MMCTVSLPELAQHVGVCKEQLEQKCARPHLEAISKEMENWIDYVHPLGLSTQEVSSIRADPLLVPSFSAQARRVLEIWYNKNGFTATYGRLASVFLEASNANIAEAVCRIAKMSAPQSSSLTACMTLTSSCQTAESSGVHHHQVVHSLLDEETRENLEGRLQAETQEMDRNFGRVVQTIRRSLERRQVNAATIGHHLSCMKAITTQVPVEDVPSLFYHNYRKLVRVDTIEELFELIIPYFSFFNYDIIEEIVSEYGDSADKETFKSYLEQFQHYCKRRATEVPPLPILDSEGPSTTKLRVKVEEDFKQDYTVKAVRGFRAKLCKILGITEPCLRLLSIEEGCILLTFSLPNSILHIVFPLTSEQEQAMAAEGGLAYSLGDDPMIRLPKELEATTKEASKDNLSKIEDTNESQPVPLNRRTSPVTGKAQSQSQVVLAYSPDSSSQLYPQNSSSPLHQTTSSPHHCTPSRPGTRRVAIPERSAKFYHSTSHSAHYSLSPASTNTTQLSPHDSSATKSHSSGPPSLTQLSPASTNTTQPLPHDSSATKSHSSGPPSLTQPLNLPLAPRNGSPPVPGRREQALHEPLRTAGISSGKPLLEIPQLPEGFSDNGDKSHYTDIQSTSGSDSSARPVASPMKRKSDTYKQQVTLLMDMYKQTKYTLGLFYTEHRELAGDIQKVVSRIFASSDNKLKVFQISHKGPHWTLSASQEGVTKYIFLSHPPSTMLDSTSEEAKFFGSLGKRVTDILFVVNVQSGAPRQALDRQWSFSSPWQKQLRKFLHLDGSSMSVEQLVNCTLAHFIASPPVPHDTDSVYWNSIPKLIRLKMKKRELGLTLSTREMSSASAFSRVVLVKVLSNDCMEELRHNVGKNTHIQSINGHFLDGLSIEQATEIIHRESEKKCVQLLVRNIHKADQSGSTAGSGKLNPSKEDLPIPVLILAHEHRRGFQLFSCLLESGIASFSSSPLHSVEPSVPHDEAKPSSDIGESDSSPPQCKPCLSMPPQTPDISFSFERLALTESSENVTPLFCSQETKSKSPTEWIIQANFYQSYKYSRTLPPISVPSGTLRQLQQREVGQKRFVFQTFREGFDQRLAHLYLRPSGVFLVVLQLEDIVNNPLREFDRLSFLLRLILSYFHSSDEKRVLIIGMLDGIKKDACIREAMQLFNATISESSLHKCVLDLSSKKRQRRQYIVLFDLSQPQKSTTNLIEKINNCSDLLITEKILYDKPFFKTVFEAFDGLNTALTELSLLTGTVASSKKLQLICSHKPSHALTSLAAYSTAYIEIASGDVLLKPGFFMNLLQKLSECLLLSLAENGKHYPIASRAQIIQELESLDPQISSDSVQIILRLAEKLGILLPIGSAPKHGAAYFAPLLTSDFLGENAQFCWDTEEEMAHCSPDAITFYVCLHFPATIHFFFELLSLFLKDGGIDRLCAENFMINAGCSKAILPQCCLGCLPAVSSVLLAYHSLQNMIEFKALCKGQFSSTEQSLYEVVLKKIKLLFQSSEFFKQHYEITSAISFLSPSPTFDDKLLDSSLWKLQELELQGATATSLDTHTETSTLLLKTKAFSLQKRSSQKEIPVEVYLKWGKKLSSSQDSWALVGSKLKLLSAEDIQLLRCKSGSGDEVLRRWLDSPLSQRELVMALRSPDVCLDSLADEIERFFH